MECFKCGRSEKGVGLLDGVSLGEIVKICEECARAENIPIIRRPTTSQLKESERSYTVRERLRRIVGLPQREEIEKTAKKITDITLDDLWRRKKEKELKERYELEKKKKKPLDLVDNFHWKIFIARRKKKLTRRQLAELLGESETAIKMIENKEIPGDALKLMRKLEQFFSIGLMKEEPEEIKAEEKKPEVKVEEKFEVPEKIPVEIEVEKEEPAKILKFDRGRIKNLTIGDLQKIKETKEERVKLDRQSNMEADDLLGEVDKEEKQKEEKRWKEESERALIGDEIELE